MTIHELPVRAFLEHLRRHPFPEIIDAECLSGLQSVEKQYGDTVSHGTGLEVRLGSPVRYVDYILNIDTSGIPGISSLWYEIDYEEFMRASRQGDRIVPCLFANIHPDPTGSYTRLWEEMLPSFAGEERAKLFRPSLDRVTALLPDGVRIRHIGTMSGRGEPEILRLVILFHSRTEICSFLTAVCWQGDTAALGEAMMPWQYSDWIHVNIDLGVDGVLPKIGFEVPMQWRHPVLADRQIACLEAEGLCLPDKAEALRKWIRIRPDGDPFIQTAIAYFKLNYRDGRIIEAKAYLEQTPYPRHSFFDAYDRPIRLDMELKNGKVILDTREARTRLEEYRRERGRLVRFFGSADYPEIGTVAKMCMDLGLETEFVLPAIQYKQMEAKLRKIRTHRESRIRLLIDLNPEEDAWDASAFQGKRIRWFMHRGNASELENVLQAAERYGAKELIVAMVRPGDRRKEPCRKQIRIAAEFIRKSTEEQDTTHGYAIRLSVESCFSPLRAMIGGADPKRNPNRGIGQGCEAGRSFLAIRADGQVTPCLWMKGGERTGSLAEYWTEASRLVSLRNRKSAGTGCVECPYSMRCLPCPEQETNCGHRVVET